MRQKFFIFMAILGVIFSFGIGTNFFAASVHYNHVLGSPQVGPFYEPFHIFWWVAWFDVKGDYYRNSFLLLTVCALLVVVVTLVFYYRGNVKKDELFGSSRWLRKSELRKQGLFNQGEDGGCPIGQIGAIMHHDKSTDTWDCYKNGKLIFSKSMEHIFGFAPTGRGKGISLVIPALMSWRRSVVCYDIKKENFSKTGGWRRTFSRLVCVEPTANESACWNPLMEIEKGEGEIAAVQNLMEFISDPNGDGNQDHWRLTAKEFLVGVCLHVLYASKDKSLAGIRAYIMSKNIQIVLLEMKETKHLGDTFHPMVASVAQSMLSKAPNELSGVVSSATSYLTLYADPIVARNTATSDFRIVDITSTDRPVSLFIVVNPNDSERLRPFTRLLLQMIGSKLTAKLDGNKHRLLFLLDEFPTLGRMDFFETQLAFFRGYGIKCMLIGQSFSQLYKSYGVHTSIIDNCRYKIFLGADTPKDGEEISKYLGQETVAKKTVSHSGKISSIALANKSVGETEQGRGLMMADEVLRLPYNKIILHIGGQFPFKADKIFYYTDKRFLARADLALPKTIEERKVEYPTFPIPIWLQMPILETTTMPDRQSLPDSEPKAVFTYVESDIDEEEFSPGHTGEDFVDV